MNENTRRILERDLASARTARLRALAELQRVTINTHYTIARALSHGMTQREVARLTGYSNGRIGQIATGRR